MNNFTNFTPHPKPGKAGKKPKKQLPKRGRNYKAASKSDKAHLALIKSLACIVCRKNAPSEAHHITSGGRRLGHLFTLPLCHEHHEGTRLSIGNTKKEFIKTFGAELELLEKVNKLIKEAK